MDFSFQQYLDNLFPTPERQEEVRRILYQAFGTMESRPIGEEPIVHIHGPSNSGKASFLSILQKAFPLPQLPDKQPQLTAMIVDIDALMHDGKRNFLYDLPIHEKARWKWLAELHENEDEDDHLLTVITTGSERRLTTVDGANYFEYKSYYSPPNSSWRSDAPCECIAALDTEAERANMHYETKLICACPRRGQATYNEYSRRLVGYHPPNDFNIVPYFGHTLMHHSYYVRDVIGVITVGYKPLSTSSTSRVTNIELTNTFTRDLNFDYDLWHKYGRKMRKWIGGYNPRVKGIRT